MSHLDRRRAELLMSEAGVDALILFSPESFSYATGAAPGVATMWRKTGAVAVLVPADAGAPETAIVSDLFARNFRDASHIEDVRESPIWVETTSLERVDPDVTPERLIRSAWKDAGRSEGFNRPTTFDPLICFRHLADALSERGLSRGRIGFEAAAVSIRDFPDLSAALGDVELVDASEVVARLKMVKSTREIGNLRQAVAIAECGIGAVRDAITEGVTRNELAAAWTVAIHNHPERASLSGAWEYISVGPDPWGGNAAARTGDQIKVDVGCLVEDYTSDSGRTFVLGPPTVLQARLYGALCRGFAAGSELLRPGVALSEVHRVTLDAIRGAGFPGYTRGHFGHGLGAGLGSEEWPFISADASLVFEPGMVMAFECPWYIDGLGGMIVENQLLITETGHEMMNTLPLDLVEIAV
jgi:Xaa-Pro aminopeptidase